MTQIPDDFITTLVAATEEVFETMVFKTVSSQPPVDGGVLRPRSDVVGTVAFVGAHSGIVAFYSTTETAREIAGAMLGMPAAEINGELPDAIGEMTNMIAGSFRTRMASHGPAWVISVPTVMVGANLDIKYCSDVRRVLCPFTFESVEVYVELVLTRGQP